MHPDVFATIPPASRARARIAVDEVFANRVPRGVERITGGASAETFRLDMADGERWLLRLDRLDDPLRNPQRGYDAMRAAAAAGIAPRLLHADAARGTALMTFIEARSLTRFPGGPESLARAFGELLRRLHDLTPFPAAMPFPDLLARMLAFIRGSTLFAPGLLDPHAERLERLRVEAGWEEATLAPCHNDPNARNVLFDGERLWLIDWETAFQNDPLVDLAIVCDQLAPTPSLQAALLQAHFAGEPPAGTLRRLEPLRRMTRLYYACLLLAGFARTPPAVPIADLAAPAPAEFRQQLADGRLREGDPRTLFVLARMMLAGFLT